MSESVAFLALAREFELVRPAVAQRFERVLASQIFVHGRETEELESALVAVSGAPFAIACSSGTSALALALRALGVGPGDAVLLPAFTFVATAGAVAEVGAVPVFTDVDRDSGLLGPPELVRALASLEPAGGVGLTDPLSGARVRAVIPVSLFGRAVDRPGLARTAREARLMVVEDAAQAIGATDAAAFEHVDAACLSFYPTKNLGGAGDGGAVLTARRELAECVRRLRNHGALPGESVHEMSGVNARMGELAAAYLNAKIERLSDWTSARAVRARWYAEELSRKSTLGCVIPPMPGEPPQHVWHQYAIRIRSGRDAVAATLREAGIETRCYYRVPLHRQPCFARGAPPALPASEAWCEEVLSLPLHPWLTRTEIAYVVGELTRAIEANP